MSIIPEGFDSRRPDAKGIDGVTRVCPECGTINSIRAVFCWRCQTTIGDEDARFDSRHAPFLVSPLFTGITLTLFVLLAGFGILNTVTASQSIDKAGFVLSVLFFIASAPSLLHLFRSASRDSLGSYVRTFSQGVGVVTSSIGVAILVVIAALVMFVVTCFPVGLAGVQGKFRPFESWLYFATGVGIVSGGTVSYLLVRRIFRRDQPLP